MPLGSVSRLGALSRRDEIADLQRDEIDWDNRWIKLSPDRNKSDRHFLLPLSDTAVQILEATPAWMEGQFMFSATIAKVDHSQKKCLWDTYQQECGISQTVFDQYFHGTDHGYAIHLSNVKPIPNQLVLEHAKKVCTQLRPPQSFQMLDPKSPLLRALNLPVHV